MNATYNAFEAFEIAEQIERNAVKFYRKAAELSDDPRASEMFLKLAEWEKVHVQVFADMRKQLSEDEKTTTTYDPDNEAALYLKTMADAKGWGIEDAASIVQRYMEDPNHPEFADLSQEDRELLETTAAARRKEEKAPGAERSHSWHWDIANRPNERDLLKAEIFLEEILEDYYGGGVDAAPMSQYLCIA